MRMAGSDDRFRLDDDFVLAYPRDAAFGFDVGGGLSLGELAFASKYSRRLADGTKERWRDVCVRVVEGTFSILRAHAASRRTTWDADKASRSAEEMFARLYDRRWMPPGRGLWAMGTDFVHGRGDSAALQNCFSGDTEIVTADAVTTLREVVGENLRVLGPKGWVDAEVRHFGVQRLRRVTFKPNGDRSNVRRSYDVTANHRWWLADGSRTDDLRVGDVVRGCVAEPTRQTAEYDAGFVHGFTFGDGCRSYTYLDGSGRYDVRLCGTKDARYLDRFVAAGWRVATTPKIAAEGDLNVTLRSDRDLKAFPVGEETEYLAGFVDGWIAADGSERGESRVLASQHPEARRWLDRYAAVAGWQVVGHTAQDGPTNYGERKSPLSRIVLRPHADWRVTSIEDLDLEDDVFCAVVPDGEAFTLAGGVLTSNCAFTTTADLPFAAARLMEMSMLGVGVGFDSAAAGTRIYAPSTTAGTPTVVDDSREGWVGAVRSLIQAYVTPGGGARPSFDLSQIRAAGVPIVGFGGVAAGPEPLRELIASLTHVLDGVARRPEPVMRTVDVGDVMNLIARCVVAGNVRRSAEIWLGPADDKEFLAAKNPAEFPVRNAPGTGWAWASNNSVIAEVGGDYSHLVDAVVRNGEPGLVYLDLARSHGRLSEPADYADQGVAGINPCAEMFLEPGELCTLANVYPTRHATDADFLRTVKFAYLYAKAVTLLPTPWPESNAVMQRNGRIGLSLGGVAELVEARGWTSAKRVLRAGYDAVRAWDRVYSRWLGVRESVRVTTEKPDGTTSLLAGVTPGVHWPVASGSYVKAMRFGQDEPEVALLAAAGFEVEEDVTDPRRVVVNLPVLGSELRSQREVSVWEKAELAAFAQAHWADNAVSATLSFRPDEERAVGDVIHVFDGRLKSVSFLPLGEDDAGAYAQMPYQAITPRRFAQMRDALRGAFDRAALYGEAAADGVGDAYCTTDSCEVPPR